MPDDKWICQGCGSNNVPGSRFCRMCQSTLAQVVIEKADNPEKTNWSKVILWSLIGFFIFKYIFFKIDSCGVVKMSPEQQEEQIRLNEQGRQKEKGS